MRAQRASLGIFVSVVWLLGWPPSSYALDPALQSGLQYLTSSQKTDGSWGDPYGTAWRETTAAADALQLLDPARPNYSTALQWLQSQGSFGYDYVSRKLYVLSQTTGDVSSDLAYLKSGQKQDGGFGLDPDHESDVADTVLALQAFAAVGQASTDTAARAVGYLLNQQQPNGGFADGANDPSVYLTALSFRALWFYRNTNTSIPAALTRARDFLLSQRDASGTWGEPFNTALVLTALVPYLPDLSSVANGISSLQSAQLANGSWVNDPYTTALALQALYLAAQPQPNPDFATIKGKVVDGQTGLPLSGVTVSLAGASSSALATQADGLFTFQKLPAGSFSLQLSLSNYSSLSTATATTTGQTVDLGVLTMVKPQGASTGTIKGIVTDAATGLALAGVTVSATGAAPVLTDVSGSYQIGNVPPGTVTISASKSAYATATGTATLTVGGVLVFSPALTPGAAPTTLAIQGTVTHGVSGAALAGVAITVGGAANASASTDAQGNYRIEGLVPGAVTVTAALAGFDTVIGSATLTPATTVLFSPRLYPSGTAPPDANTTGIIGVVRDANTNAPLSGVSVTLNGPSTQSSVTQGDGALAFRHLPVGSYTLRLAHANYATLTVSLAVNIAQLIDLGALGLTPLQNPTTGTIRGTVTDAATGLPLAGVTITATGSSPMLTDASGSYQISNVAPGPITLSAAKDGYMPVTGSATLVAGGTLLFSPALVPGPAQTATVEGRVTHGVTGAVLPGVAINVSGASIASALTDAQGRYRIEGLNPGVITVMASLAGFDAVSAGGQVSRNSTIAFSPKLYPSGTTPPNANTAGLTGIVLDAGTPTSLSAVWPSPPRLMPPSRTSRPTRRAVSA
jgi:hypothetical protein